MRVMICLLAFCWGSVTHAQTNELYQVKFFSGFVGVQTTSFGYNNISFRPGFQFAGRVFHRESVDLYAGLDLNFFSARFDAGGLIFEDQIRLERELNTSIVNMVVIHKYRTAGIPIYAAKRTENLVFTGGVEPLYVFSSERTFRFKSFQGEQVSRQEKAELDRGKINLFLNLAGMYSIPFDHAKLLVGLDLGYMINPIVEQGSRTEFRAYRIGCSLVAEFGGK